MEDQPSETSVVCRLDTTRKAVEPCSIVIFGASGDLTARKLIPAFYQLFKEKQMPPDFRIIGFARREKTNDSWRAELREALDQFSRTKPVDEKVWQDFAPRISYCMGEFSDLAAYKKLEQQLSAFGSPQLRNNLLFYLATSPSQFAEVVEQMHTAGLLHQDNSKGWERIVVEKPFGHDLASAVALNGELTRYAHEQQVFRIDHYLGKETVQNILMFRFSNSIFERLWNRDSVDHVQITVGENLGVGQRGGYYEEAGALRDMVQNHLLQVLSLITMEPPVSLEAEPIRDEKVKLLKSIRPLLGDDVAKQVVRGQYFAGTVNGKLCPGYRQEAKVKPDSNVETFAALKLFIDNWRWSGVPFYLRTGKYLPLSASEVRIQFRPTPNVLFAAQCGNNLDPNAITLRLQPDEGISLRFNGKVPGASTMVRPVRMSFNYNSEFGAYTPEAYERLLIEAMAGDATLFIRRDEVETAWSIVDSIRKAWDGQPLSNREFYAAGTWGPVAADDLLAQRGHAWRNPQPLELIMAVNLSSFPNDAALAAAAAADWLVQLRAQKKSGKPNDSYCVALSGGRIAKSFFTEITRQAANRVELFNSVHFFWADERCVPPGDPESNYTVARQLLFGPMKIPDARIHRLRGEENEALALRDALENIKMWASSGKGTDEPIFDMIFLGMGEDGHVASLFPGEPEAVMADPAFYRAVTAVKPPPRRITLGYSAIIRALEVRVMVSGAGKEASLKESLSPAGKTPLARVIGQRSSTEIYSDIAPA